MAFLQERNSEVKIVNLIRKELDNRLLSANPNQAINTDDEIFQIIEQKQSLIQLF